MRNEVRSWLDYFEDNDFDRAKCLEFLLSFATDSKHKRLWTYVVSALQEFPLTNTTRAYSESTAISSFILPICRVFVAAPDKKLFLNFVDSTYLSGKATSSRKEPDLGLDIKDEANKTICNVGVAEVTSIAQKGCRKKNAKDLKQRLHLDSTMFSNRLLLAKSMWPLQDLFFRNEFQLLEPQNSRLFSPRSRLGLVTNPTVA
ncbi:hypothetical protein EDD21DRAFT_162792 [Dissophora ornata]|nr:hypothetical protein EDD21DRAFT_162792 [Dissophora ornata]